VKLKIYLLTNGITLTEFSNMIGYTRSFISRVINGHVSCSERFAKQIENATNGEVTMQDLKNGVNLK